MPVQVDQMDYDRRIDAYGKLDSGFWEATSPLQATLLLHRSVWLDWLLKKSMRYAVGWPLLIF